MPTTSSFDPDVGAVKRARDSLPASLAGRVAYRVASGKAIEVEPGPSTSLSSRGRSDEWIPRTSCTSLEALRPGGLVLDLQAIRPNPVVESDGVTVCDVDGEPLVRLADAATAAVDAAIAAGWLVEEATDDHDIRKHCVDGPELVEDFAGKRRRIPGHCLPFVRGLTRPCAVRERCRCGAFGSARRATRRLASDRLSGGEAHEHRNHRCGQHRAHARRAMAGGGARRHVRQPYA
jgi:hypothetical protein